MSKRDTELKISKRILKCRLLILSLSYFSPCHPYLLKSELILSAVLSAPQHLGTERPFHSQWPEPGHGTACWNPSSSFLPQSKIQIFHYGLPDLTTLDRTCFGNLITALQSAHAIPATWRLLWPIKVDFSSRTFVPTAPSSWRHCLLIL